MWVCTDSNRNVIGLNENNMNGNTGWQELEPCLLTLEMDIFDQHDTPLYKLDGETVQRRSEEERREEWPEVPEIMNQAARIAELEAQVEEMRAIITELTTPVG